MFIRCCLVKLTVEQTTLEFKRKTILTSILRLGKIEKLIQILVQKF